MTSKLQKALKKVNIDSLLERFIDWYFKTREEIDSKRNYFKEQAKQEKEKICRQLGYDDERRYAYEIDKALRGREISFTYKFEDEDIEVECKVIVSLLSYRKIDIIFTIHTKYPKTEQFSDYSFIIYDENHPLLLENYDISIPVAIGVIENIYDFAKEAIKDVRGCITLIKLICIASVFSYLNYAKGTIFNAPLNRKAIFYFCKKAVYISIYELRNLLRIVRKFSYSDYDNKEVYTNLIKNMLKKRYIILW